MDIETIITNNNNVQENVNNQKSSLFLDLMNLNNYKFREAYVKEIMEDGLGRINTFWDSIRYLELMKRGVLDEDILLIYNNQITDTFLEVVSENLDYANTNRQIFKRVAFDLINKNSNEYWYRGLNLIPVYYEGNYEIAKIIFSDGVFKGFEFKHVVSCDTYNLISTNDFFSQEQYERCGITKKRMDFLRRSFNERLGPNNTFSCSKFTLINLIKQHFIVNRYLPSISEVIYSREDRYFYVNRNFFIVDSYDGLRLYIKQLERKIDNFRQGLEADYQVYCRNKPDIEKYIRTGSVEALVRQKLKDNPALFREFSYVYSDRFSKLRQLENTKAYLENYNRLHSFEKFY